MRKKLGEMLIEAGVLTESVLRAALSAPDPHLLCFTRSHPAHGTFTMIANFGRST